MSKDIQQIPNITVASLSSVVVKHSFINLYPSLYTSSEGITHLN